jgi:G3E family GTPase
MADKTLSGQYSGKKADKKIPLYLISGFLGSGKTTLLQTLLGFYRSGRAGVIVNEFGDLGIDGSRLPVRDGIITTELNGGQIFCSCLSGSFVDSIAAFADTGIDVLFVEASGLAKPAPMMEILSYADRKSNGAFDYRGMLCIIDASRYLVLRKSLLTITEQVAFSDRFIINKTDLVSPEILDEITASIQEIKPGAPIRLTTYGHIDRGFLEDFRKADSGKGGVDASASNGEGTSNSKSTSSAGPHLQPVFAGWGPQGRPVPIKLVPASPPDSTALRAFIQTEADRTYRIKGTVDTSDQGLLTIDCVGDTVSVSRYPSAPASGDSNPESPESGKPDPGASARLGLVLIFPGDSKEPGRLLAEWKETCGIGAFISTST